MIETITLIKIAVAVTAGVLAGSFIADTVQRILRRISTKKFLAHLEELTKMVDEQLKEETKKTIKKNTKNKKK